MIRQPSIHAIFDRYSCHFTPVAIGIVASCQSSLSRIIPQRDHQHNCNYTQWFNVSSDAEKIESVELAGRPPDPYFPRPQLPRHPKKTPTSPPRHDHRIITRLKGCFPAALLFIHLLQSSNIIHTRPESFLPRRTIVSSKLKRYTRSIYLDEASIHPSGPRHPITLGASLGIKSNPKDTEHHQNIISALRA